MSSNEKRLRGGETDSSSSSIRRIGSTITMPRPLPPPMTSSPTSTSLTTTTSPSSPSSIPLRRSHSSLHKMPSSSSGAMGGASSQASLVPQQRYLEVPDAASMISTHQRRTPSSASLLFGSYSMASTPTPPISSNSRRLAGNIPGAVIKVKSSSPLLNRNLDTLTIPRSPASRRAALKAKASHNNPTNPIQIDARFPQDLSYKQSKKRHSVESLSGSCKATYFLNLI